MWLEITDENNRFIIGGICRHSNKNFAEFRTTVCDKKYPVKFFAIFLATAQNFYINFTHLLHIHNHVKLPSSIVLFLTMTKLFNFLGDHILISDVHGMFAERTTHHIL